MPDNDSEDESSSKIRSVTNFISGFLNPVSSSTASSSSNTQKKIVEFIRGNEAETSLTGTKNEAENRSYWMSDSAVKNCYNCDKEFSVTRRKHHCRFCGQIFCWKCAPIRTPPLSVRSCQKCIDLRKKMASTTINSISQSSSTSLFVPDLRRNSIPLDLNSILTSFEKSLSEMPRPSSSIFENFMKVTIISLTSQYSPIIIITFTELQSL